MAFEPIAIVGRGCVLPGCLTPDALWQAVVEKRSLLSSPAPGLWGISDLDQAEGTPKGGFVTGFADVFDPARPEYEVLDVGRLDPVAQWLLHAGGEAWREAGIQDAAPDRIAVIIGNLSYPSRGFSNFAADVWLERTGTKDPRNRFNSGYPAQALAQSIGANGPTFALDAACASSLYAIKLACDRLQDRSVDVALAGAVQAADSLIINRGFAALQALSPTGRTRPLVEGADGLVPAEDAAAIVLKRLSDISPGERVHGVIRSVGL
ncbi:MAG: polyketide synthase, partial [Hyphomonadaceae bacterium]